MGELAQRLVVVGRLEIDGDAHWFHDVVLRRARLLRPGNAGSGTAADHVAVLDDALAQLPIDDSDVIVRADSAGWSHASSNTVGPAT